MRRLLAITLATALSLGVGRAGDDPARATAFPAPKTQSLESMAFYVLDMAARQAPARGIPYLRDRMTVTEQEAVALLAATRAEQPKLEPDRNAHSTLCAAMRAARTEDDLIVVLDARERHVVSKQHDAGKTILATLDPARRAQVLESVRAWAAINPGLFDWDKRALIARAGSIDKYRDPLCTGIY